jgi:ammonium transporter, Amt family
MRHRRWARLGLILFVVGCALPALAQEAVHGLGGTWGALATGLFATKAVNPAGADGVFYGNPAQFLNQLQGVGAAWILAIVGTFVILKVVSFLTPLRVSEEDEMAGLDLALHGEVAYNPVAQGSAAHLP